MKDVMAGLQQTNSEKILLSWVRQNTRQYPQVGSFTDARLDHGRGFAADPESENSKCRRYDHPVSPSSAVRTPVSSTAPTTPLSGKHMAFKKMLSPQSASFFPVAHLNSLLFVLSPGRTNYRRREV